MTDEQAGAIIKLEPAELTAQRTAAEVLADMAEVERS
jgi:hypothetical protein